MLRHKQFWITLLVSVVGWFAITMSEHNEYSLAVHIEWTGFDTAKYAVTYADSVMPIQINSNYFHAVSHYFIVKHTPYKIQVSGDTTLNIRNTFFDSFCSQMKLKGVQRITSPMENIRIDLSERCSKAYVPKMRGVDFQFVEQRGLSGKPYLSPDTVWLYGDSATLAKIDELYTTNTTISDVEDSAFYYLPLEPVWKDYPDVWVSTDVVKLYVPVDRYSEKTIKVPIRLLCDSEVKMRVYPQTVEVTFWVSTRYYGELDSESVEAVVEYDVNSHSKELPVRITRFPSYSRVKQVSPASLQYVIIK